MNQPSSEQRPLRFETWDDGVAELHSLIADGYRRSGNWTLAAVADHCRIWLEAAFERPVEMSKLMAIPMAVVGPIVRRTIGPKMLTKILDRNAMSAGLATVPATVRDDAEQYDAAEDAAAVECLTQTIERFKRHDGEILPSPLFGEMDRDSADHMHRIHLAHHLGFLIPNTVSRTPI